MAATGDPGEDGTDDGGRSGTVWTRWDGRGEDWGRVYPHEYCTWLGVEPADGTAPPVAFFPRREMFADADSLAERIDVALGVLVRHLLRNTPTVVLALALLYNLDAAFVSPAIHTVWAFVPGSIGLIPGIVVVVVVWSSMLYLLLDVLYGEEDRDASAILREVVPAIASYGWFLALLAATGISFYLVTVDGSPVDMEPNTIYAAGYLLLLLVTGHLFYDQMLRVETLFSRLHETDVIASPESGSDGEESRPEAVREGYTREFLGPLIEDLSDRTGISTAFVVAAIFVSQYVVLWNPIWRLTDGPFVLGGALTFLATVIMNFVIAAVAVQFLVLIKHLNDLLAGEYETFEVAYRPAHEDGFAGFGDLGRFVTRTNWLLMLAGVYLAYRLHVQGQRDPLLSAVTSGAPSLDAAIWLYSYLLPVGVYLLVAAVWLYFSFWQIHRRMVEAKTDLIHRSTDRHKSRPEIDYAEWETIHDAPVWPIDTNLLVTVMSLDFVVPVLVTVSSILLS